MDGQSRAENLMECEEYWVIEDFKDRNNDTPLQQKLSITIDESLTKDSENAVSKISIKTEGQILRPSLDYLPEGSPLEDELFCL